MKLLPKPIFKRFPPTFGFRTVQVLPFCLKSLEMLVSSMVDYVWKHKPNEQFPTQVAFGHGVASQQ